MPPQADLDRTYLQMAKTWAELSKARRKKVGCLIVKDGAIISDGYNGTPKGFDNNCEMLGNAEIHQDCGDHYNNQYITKPEVLHAESNAIIKLAKSTQSSDGATIYITISPCLDCAKLIIQAGIKRIVYGRLYRDSKGVSLLTEAGIDALEHDTGIKNY